MMCVDRKAGKTKPRKKIMTLAKPTTKEISFFSEGFKLKGYLHLPTARQPPVVIGCHGLYSSGSSPKQLALADQCNRYGIAYFRFDHRGCGSSEGDFEKVTSLEARCRDLTDAVAAITGASDTCGRLGFFGSSMGGTVCLSVAGALGANTLVTFAVPIRSRIQPEELPVTANSKSPEIFLDAQKRRFDITDRLSTIGNILIFHGEADDVVPIVHAEELYRLVKQPKKLIKQKLGDHPMSNKAHQKTFIEQAALWFKRGLI